MKYKNLLIAVLLSFTLLSCKGEQEIVNDNNEDISVVKIDEEALVDVLDEEKEKTVEEVVENTENNMSIDEDVENDSVDVMSEDINENIEDVETEDRVEDVSAPKQVENAENNEVNVQKEDSVEAVENDTDITLVLDDNIKKNLVVAIDPGHQAKGNYEKEPIGPGSSTTKAKTSSGTTGITTNIPEYKLVLDISLKLQDELKSRGYDVVMTRESHDVDLSNIDRAAIATENNADIFIRVHADGNENQSANGVSTISPTSSNPFVAHLYNDSYHLSDVILDELAKSTGAKKRNIIQTDSMSGINWATMPVTIVEVGFMTNPNEEKLMFTDEYQNKISNGIANGVDKYFLNE